MEIRRVDPELIPPTTAKDHGSRVAMDRKHPEQTPERKRGKHAPPEDSPDEQQEASSHEHKAANADTYNPGGHVQHGDPDQEPHTIDFIA